MKEYIIKWTPCMFSKDNKPYYQGQGHGTTFSKEEARTFGSKKEASMYALRMCQIGYTGPTIVKNN